MYSEFYGTALSHIASLIVGLGVIFKVSKCHATYFLLWSQILVVTNSLVAVFRYGLRDGYRLRKLHVITLNLSMIGSFSLLHSILHTTVKARPSFYVLTALNIIPLLQNLSKLDYRSRLRRSDAILAMNCFFFFWTSALSENFFAAALAVSFSFGYFFVGDSGHFLDTEMPSIDLYQYMQCFQSFFALYSYCD